MNWFDDFSKNKLNVLLAGVAVYAVLDCVTTYRVYKERLDKLKGEPSIGKNYGQFSSSNVLTRFRDQRLKNKKVSKIPQVTTICLTGGKYAYAKIMMTTIKERLQDANHNVIIVPAMEAITYNQDIELVGCLNYDEQIQITINKMKIQKSILEYNKQLAIYSGLDTIILFEQGIIDHIASLGQSLDEVKEDISDQFESFATLRDKYFDHVFYLIPDKDKVKELTQSIHDFNRFYEEVKAQNKQYLDLYNGHPSVFVVDNPVYDHQTEKILQCIQKNAGFQVTSFGWRKYLLSNVKWPDNINIVTFKLIDTFLQNQNPNITEVLRVRSSEGQYDQFQHITRIRENNHVKEVAKRFVTVEESAQLLKRKYPDLKSLHRERCCLTYEDQALQIDVFTDLEIGILRVPQPEEQSNVFKCPKWIQVHKNVTDDPAFLCHNLVLKL